MLWPAEEERRKKKAPRLDPIDRTRDNNPGPHLFDVGADEGSLPSCMPSLSSMPPLVLVLPELLAKDDVLPKKPEDPLERPNAPKNVAPLTLPHADAFFEDP